MAKYIEIAKYIEVKENKSYTDKTIVLAVSIISLTLYLIPNVLFILSIFFFHNLLPKIVPIAKLFDFKFLILSIIMLIAYKIMPTPSKLVYKSVYIPQK